MGLIAAVIQIVSAVGAAGVVLMDLNRAPSGVGALLGPRREIKLADVAMAAPAGDSEFLWPPSPEGGAPRDLTSRQITVPVVVQAATADGAAALVRQLQALTRARFVLRIQRHGATAPVWLRCLPCVPQLDTHVAAAGQPTRIVAGTLTTATEPYALGDRVDVGPFTVTQDPASGTPFAADITVTQGDSLTPLVLRSTDANLRNVVDRTLISIRRRGTPTNLTGLVVQGESATIGQTGPAVATFTGDSSFSGGGGMRATYTASGAGSDPWSVIATWPSLTGAEAPGLYRLLMRVRRTGGAAGALFSIVWTTGADRHVEMLTAGGNDTRIIASDDAVQLPVGAPPFMAAPAGPVSTAAPSIAVAFVRAAPGTGTLDLDWLMLVPADQDCGALEVATGLPSGAIALDGWDHQPRAFTADPYTGTAPAAAAAGGLSFIGGAPRLAPGPNRLYLVCGLGLSAASARTPASTLTVSGSYWPRYGWLA